MLPEGERKMKKYEIDMTQGSLFKNIVTFSIPLMLSGILQLLYNAADVVVVGRFAGSDSLAAVGSTSSLFNLLLNLFMGFATGTSVLVARAYGSKNNAEVSKTVHTAITLSVIFGVSLGAIGFIIARPVLLIMGTPENVIEKATLYIRILFMGMPAKSVYNFGSAILRSVGDTKRPLYFLTVSGLFNVVANLFFVIAFHMDVAGVATATIMAEYISATLVMLCLIKSEGSYRVMPKRIRIYKKQFVEMLKVGIPAAIQGCIFSISNVLIQSSINLFGSVAMAGSSVSGNLEGFVYTSMSAVYQGAITSTGQNLGARNFKRIKKTLWTCLVVVSGFGLLMTAVITLFREPIIGIYTSEADVMEYAIKRLNFVMLPYVMCGIMEISSGIMRGMGHAVTPMVVSILGACGVRILWLATVFQAYKTFEVLFLCYIVSWTITTLAHQVCIFFAFRKLKKTLGEDVAVNG